MLPPRLLVSSVIAAWLASVALAACSGDEPPPIGDPAPAVCPTHLDLELIARESRFDPGSSGLTHGVGLATGSDLSVEISGCDEDCRRCNFRGPVRADPAIRPVISQRCLNGVAQTCEADPDCPGATGPCRFMFPPITTRTAGAPTCALAYFEPVPGADPSPVQGVTDLYTGEADMPVLSLHIQVAIGGSCVDCQGDPAPFDGERGGTCMGSTTACDVNGLGTVIASQTSYDCPPPPNGLQIALPVSGTSTASRRWTLDATRPRCTQGGASTAEPCFCGVCTNGKPCTSSLDCPSGACGFAGSTMTPINVANNGCPGTGTCVWNEAAQRGTCSNEATRSCFPDGAIGQELIATGEASVGDGFFLTQLANLTCMPSLGNALIDAIGGYPGPLLFEARFRVTARTEVP